MKLLRPLHRQRRRRQTRFIVLGNDDLAAHFSVPLCELQAHMERHNLPFHKDSRGNMWASCELNPLGNALEIGPLGSQKATRH